MSLFFKKKSYTSLDMSDTDETMMSKLETVKSTTRFMYTAFGLFALTVPPFQKPEDPSYSTAKAPPSNFDDEICEERIETLVMLMTPLCHHIPPPLIEPGLWFRD